jgi:uncharacterized protein YecE (DUF72 family)
MLTGVRLWIGTSGFHYRHWRGRFYPAGLPTVRWLAFYAQRFSTVELNAPFYRLPPGSTFAAWADTVPDGFRFAVKASRYLTHVLRLQEPKGPVELLLDRCLRLGDRMGPVLVQLPPDLPAHPDRLARTLEAFPPDVRVAVEPRHASWWHDEVASVLRAHGAALCWADRRGSLTPPWTTASWRYLRLHEGRADPAPCYGLAELEPWVRVLAGETDAVDDAWVYFNNDPRACALRDAGAFAELARSAGLTTTRVPDPASIPVGTDPPGVAA